MITLMGLFRVFRNQESERTGFTCYVPTWNHEWLRATEQLLNIPAGDSQLLLTLAKPAEVPKLMRAEDMYLVLYLMLLSFCGC